MNTTRARTVEDEPSPPKGAAALQRALVRAGRGPLRGPLALAYESAARAYARGLLAGLDGASAYARGSLASRSPAPGLSDIDLAVVVGSAADRRVAEERHARLERRAPWVARAVLERPRTYVHGELERIAGHSVFTYPGAAYAPGASRGVVRQLERPELGAAVRAWRRLAGPERRPSPPPRDAQARRVAAWLELQYRWRWAWRAFAGELPPLRAGDVVAKLVLGTAAALEEAGRPAPAEAELAAARTVEERPDLAPPDAAGSLLATALGLADRLAAAVERDLAEVPHDEVKLLGAPPAGTVRGRLPLADFRAVACPEPLGAALVVDGGDPADPTALAAAERAARGGPYVGLRSGRVLLVAPGGFYRGALRTVQCAATDPVTFALLDGRDVARFPRVSGWSAADWARRAAIEHAAWRHEPALRPAAERARAFAESVERGEPELRLTG